jgi:hypothetical protein
MRNAYKLSVWKRKPLEEVIRWEDNINMGVKETGYEVWNTFHWLRIGTSRGVLSTQQWTSELHKRKVICWPPKRLQVFKKASTVLDQFNFIIWNFLTVVTGTKCIQFSKSEKTAFSFSLSNSRLILALWSLILKQYLVVCFSDVDGTFKDRSLNTRLAVEKRNIFNMTHYTIRNYNKYQYRKMFEMTCWPYSGLYF